MAELAPSDERAESSGGRYRNVLVPIDGSEGSRRGVDRGLEIAREHDACLHVLHVIEESTRGETPALSSNELVLEAFEEEASALIEEIVAEAEAAGVEAETACVRGDTPHEIRAYAETYDVDLIVMGVHGTRDGARPHRGGTTDTVARAAAVPVVSV